MHWLGLISGLVQLAGATFLLLSLAAGVLQDADQWSQHSRQMVAHISLLTIGGGVGVLSGAMVVWEFQIMRLEKRWTSATGFLAAALVTVASIPLGWDYWLEFGSNISFLVVVTISAISVLIYLAIGTIQIGRRWESRTRLSC